MGRTLTEERQQLKELAKILAGLEITRPIIAKYLNLPEGTIKRWLWKETIIMNPNPTISNQNGELVHNSGYEVHNFRDGLPPNPKPQLHFSSPFPPIL